jgi:RNA polymerase sigma factor (sigma-70 family)
MGRTSSRFERFKEAAATLSPLERDVLFLSARVGLPNSKIAELLGISERRAERLLGSAIFKFDRAVQKEEDP